MSYFDDEILNIFRDVTDITMSVTQQVGVRVTARHNVTMVNIVSPTKKRQYGFQGTSSNTERQPSKTVFDPQPRVKIKKQYRSINGLATAMGDALVSNIMNGKYTRNMLEEASYFLIDDEIYDLVKGQVKEEPNGVFLSMIVSRREQNRKRVDHG
jgi:hypothetical protein